MGAVLATLRHLPCAPDACQLNPGCIHAVALGSDPAENLDMPPHTHDGQGHGHPSHGHHEDAVGGLGLLSLLVCIPAVVLLVLLGYCAGKRARGHARDASFASGVDLQDQRGDKISRWPLRIFCCCVPPAPCLTVVGAAGFVGETLPMGISCHSHCVVTAG